MNHYTTEASFTKGVNPLLAKRQLKPNERLANHGLTSFVKETAGMPDWHWDNG